MQAKICGVKNAETLNFIIKHKHPPKFIGFICNYPKSHRNLKLKNLISLINVKKKKVKFVAVLVSPKLSLLKKITKLIFDQIGFKNLIMGPIRVCNPYSVFLGSILLSEKNDRSEGWGGFAPKDTPLWAPLRAPVGRASSPHGACFGANATPLVCLGVSESETNWTSLRSNETRLRLAARDCTHVC